MKFKYLVIYYDGRQRVKKLFVVPEASDSEEAKRITADARLKSKKNWRACALRLDKMNQLWSWD